MQDTPRFVSAASLSLEAFADVFTNSYEGYAYNVRATARDVAARVRTEQLDLYRSLVMLVGDEPAGQATLALRGTRAWCGGFGMCAPWRGRGLAHALLAALLDQAREAGAHSLSLEVLAKNAAAIATYARGGLIVRRDLLVLEWQSQPPQSDPTSEPPALTPFGLAEAASLFEPLHPTPAAWQRDLPTLLARGSFEGVALRQGGEVLAYALYSAGPDGGMFVGDLGARGQEHARALLTALQARATRIISINEPADSPLTAALTGLGFVERDRQHEMWVELAPGR
jgi:GNAT superfamily N-acetyltransferase